MVANSAWSMLRELLQKLPPIRAGQPRIDFEALFNELTHAANDNLERMQTDVYAPCDYLVSLSLRDMDDLESKGKRPLLQRALQKAMRDHMRDKGYLTQEPVTVRLEGDANLQVGFLGVTVRFVAHDPAKPDLKTVIRPPQGNVIAHFEVLDGPQQGDILPLVRMPAQIGRLAPNHHPEVALQDDKRWVGRHHARVEQSGNDFFLIDTDSENGTEVNGMPIAARERVPLNDGTEIRIAGRVTLRFHVGARSVSLNWSQGKTP